jgi:hypothetical protein
MGLRVVPDPPFKVHGNGELDHKGAATSRFVQMLQHVAHLGVFGPVANGVWDRQTVVSSPRSVVTGRRPLTARAAASCELDILRLQMAPALDFGLVPLFWKALEVFRGQLFGGRALSGEFLADERVSCHRALGGTNVPARPWFV